MMKQTNFFNTAWSDRGPAERIFLLAGAGISSIVIFRQIGKLTGFIRQTSQNIQTSAELQQWQNVGQNLSYQNTQYQIFAESLYTAMKGFGTNENAVRDVMQRMNNNADILKLIQVFGVRDGYGLSAWITDDFSSKDKEKYINQVLRSKGITYQF